MLNNVNQVGRTTKDVELRYTNNGTAVGNVNIAVKRNQKNQSGEYESDFFQLVIWGKTAEAVAQYARKGSLISVTGRLVQESWQDQNGNNRQAVKIHASDVSFIQTNNNNEQGNQNQGQAQQQNGNGQQQQQQTQNPFGANEGAVDLNDDDLPF